MNMVLVIIRKMLRDGMMALYSEAVRIYIIYNPWSILNYLDKREYGTYWANTSANSLVGRLIRESNRDIKQKFEDLLNDKSIWCEIDEQNFAGNIQFL